jgi:hypothetical protein
MSVHSATGSSFVVPPAASSKPAWLEEEFPSGPKCKGGPSRSALVSASAGKALDALGICQGSLRPLPVRPSTILSPSFEPSRNASELADRVRSQRATKFEMPEALRAPPQVTSSRPAGSFSDRVITFPDSTVGFVAQIELAQCLWQTNREQLFGLHGTLAGIEFAGTAMSESLLPERVDQFMEARGMRSPDLRKAYIKALPKCAQGEEHGHQEGLGDTLKALGAHMAAHTAEHRYGKKAGIGTEFTSGMEANLTHGNSLVDSFINVGAHSAAGYMLESLVSEGALVAAGAGVVASLDPKVQEMEKRCAGMAKGDLVGAADCYQSAAIAKVPVSIAKGIDWSVHHLLVVPLEQAGHAVVDAIKDPIPKAFKGERTNSIVDETRDLVDEGSDDEFARQWELKH